MSDNIEHDSDHEELHVGEEEEEVLPQHAFLVDASECIFLSRAEFTSLHNKYAFVNEDSLSAFIESIADFAWLPNLFIHQNYFYSNPSDWCAFQDALAQLIAMMPSHLLKLERLYVKFDVHCPSGPHGFQAVDLKQISDKRLFAREYTNAFEMLAHCLPFMANVDVHLIFHTNSSVHTKQFFDSMACLPRLKSLNLKYYFEDILGDHTGEDSRSLLRHFFKSLQKCTAVERLSVNVHGKQQQLLHAPGGLNRSSFANEIKELTTALAACKVLNSVALHLPVQFFFSDFIAEKSLPQNESSIKKNMRLLCKNKSIKYFDLILTKEKHSPDLRRKTQQILIMQNFIERSVQSSIKQLVQYKC